jgi:hypothetical protein
MTVSFRRHIVTNLAQNNALTASDLQIALSDIYPDSTYGAVPVIDQCDALEAYRAFDDGGLAEVPLALAISCTRHSEGD